MSNRFTFDASPPAPNPRGHETPAGPSKASRYAVLSSIASVVMILASGIAIAGFLHNVNLTFWWAPTTVLLIVALAVAVLAQNCLPSVASPRGNAQRVWVATAWLMFVAAGVVFAITFLPMALLLRARSAEGRAALREARKVQEIALQAQQITNNRQAQIEANYQHDLHLLDQESSSLQRQLSQLIKAAELREAQTLLAEKKLAEKQRDSDRSNYQKAVLGTLFVSDPQQPLPVSFDDVAWENPKHNVESNYQQLQSAATPQPLFADEQTANGLTIRRSNLRGSDFIPKIGLFNTKDQSGRDQVFVSLVSYSGEELEISAADWTLQRTTNLGALCDDLSYSGATLYVVQQQANKILLVRHITEDTRSTGGDRVKRQGYAYKIISPQRIAANNSTSSIQFTTDTSTPMLAEMTHGDLKKVRELRPGNAQSTSFLPSQLGQDVFLDGEREIFVAQADGIYRTRLSQPPATDRLPAHRTESNGGYISLDGEQFVAFQHRWPVASLAWQKVIPAAGIDVNLFANFGTDLLATANAQTNLLLYDRQGKLHSRHNWPNAGKTLGIAGLRDRGALVVFTEQSIFVVTFGQRERPSQSVDLATNSPRPPAAPSRLTTIAQLAQPTAEVKNIAGDSYDIPGAKVHALKLQQCKEWAWGDTAEYLYAMPYGVLHKVNTKTRTIERSITLAKENYSDLALKRTKSRLLVIMPKQKQLVALDPATLEAKTFAIDDFAGWYANELLGLAASPRVEWFALLSGKGSDSRIDVVDPRDGKILWTVTPQELNPPPTELGWFAIGPDDNSLVCMPQNRICWIRFSGKTWQQSPVGADLNTKWHNATPLAWPANGCVYWGGGRSYNGLNLLKPGEPAPAIQLADSSAKIEFDPSGKFYWTNDIKKIDVATQKELASYPMQQRAYSFARSPDPKILRSGYSIVEITSP